MTTAHTGFPAMLGAEMLGQALQPISPLSASPVALQAEIPLTFSTTPTDRFVELQGGVRFHPALPGTGGIWRAASARDIITPASRMSACIGSGGGGNGTAPASGADGAEGGNPVPPAGGAGGGGRPPDAFELLMGKQLEDAVRAHETTTRLIETAGPNRNRTIWFDLDDTIFKPECDQTKPLTYGSNRLIGVMIGVMSAIRDAGFRIGINSAAGALHVQYFLEAFPQIRMMLTKGLDGKDVVKDGRDMGNDVRLFLKCVGRNRLWINSSRVVGIALAFEYFDREYTIWLPKIMPPCDILIDDQVEHMRTYYADKLSAIRKDARGLPRSDPLRMLEKYVEWCLEHYRSGRYVMVPVSWDDEQAVRQFEASLKNAFMNFPAVRSGNFSR